MKGIRDVLVYVGLVGATASGFAQPVSYTGGVLTENFDGMGSSGTTTPPGWYVGWHNGSSASGSILRSNTVLRNDGTVGPAGGTAGFNCGSTNASDQSNRSLGTGPTSTSSPNGTNRFIEVQIRNDTAQTFPAIRIAYTGKQWRTSSSTVGLGYTNTLQYSGNGINYFSVGPAFDLHAPVTTPANQALNGNQPANSITNVGGLYLPPVALAPSAIAYLRWLDINDPSTDPILAIDDFMFVGVLPEPVAIATQPADLATVAGQPASFRVSANGAPLYYQWFRNGSRILGAVSATYTIPGTRTNDDGSIFSVVVSNSLNVVTSRVATLRVFPDQSTTMISLTNTLWEYRQDGAELGTLWKELDYSDSDWLTGIGVLAQENNTLITPWIHTVLSLANSTGQRVITYYFRTQFTCTNDPADLFLTFTNLLDDGAVIYVNGVECLRYRVPLQQNSQTLAQNPDEEGVFEIAVVGGSVLRRGENVVAAEVHQSSTTSSDVVFGLSLRSQPLRSGPLVLVRAPTNYGGPLGESVMFSPEIAGQEPILYQWQKEGIAIPDGTNASLSIAQAGPADAGSYTFIASNIFGTFTSGPVQLTFVGTDPLKPLPFFPMGGIWERDIIVTSWVDVDSTAGARDWLCGATTFDGHTGNDVELGLLRPEQSMDAGWPVFAALDGVVSAVHDGSTDAKTDCLDPTPNAVVLNHGYQQTYYTHLKQGSVLVFPGQPVKAGEQIGWVGRSGCLSVPKLHWGVEYNGKPYEPFVGACHAGDTGWIEQPTYHSSMYVYQAAATVDAIPAGTVVQGPRLVGIKFAVANMPAGCSYRMCFRRPDGSVALDTGNHGINNSGAYRTSWWLYHFWGYFDVAGNWSLDLLLNETPAVTVPLTVVAAASEVTNRAPWRVSLEMFPEFPTTNDVLFCRIVEPWVARDPDYDLVRYRYRWTLNGHVIRETTHVALSDAIPYGMASEGAELYCTVTPDDGHVDGPSATISTVCAPPLPTIFQQPQSLTVPEGRPTTLRVGVGGFPLSYQWFKDDAPIPEATQSTYPVTATSVADAGQYFVVVRNPGITVTSALATVNVYTWPPPCPPADSAQPIVSRWVGGSGRWSDPGHWDNGIVPHDCDPLLFDVIVDPESTKTTVEVDVPIRIHRLFNSARLRITDELTVLDGITNRGVMTAAFGRLNLTRATVDNTGHVLTADRGTICVSNSVVVGGSLYPTDDPESAVLFAADVTLTQVDWGVPGRGRFLVPARLTEASPATRLLGDRIVPYGQRLECQHYGCLDLTGGEFRNEGTIALTIRELPHLSYAGTTELRVGFGNLVNNGLIDFEDSQRWSSWPSWIEPVLYVVGDCVISGAGTIALGAPSLIRGDSTRLTVGPGQRVRGNFGAYGWPGSLDLVNDGTIETDHPSWFMLTGLNLHVLWNRGTIQAFAGGHLQLHEGSVTNDGMIAGRTDGRIELLETVVKNTGSIEAGGGIVHVESCVISGGALLTGTATNSYISFNGEVTLNNVRWGPTNNSGYHILEPNDARLLGDRCVPTGQRLVIHSGARLHVDQRALTNQGVIRLWGDAQGDATILMADALLVNDGLIHLDRNPAITNGQPSRIILGGGPCTVAGVGEFFLPDLGSDYVATFLGERLTNGPQHRIRGTGLFQNEVVNLGVIQASLPGKAMTFQNSVRNLGTLAAYYGAVLEMEGALTVDGLGRIVGDTASILRVKSHVTGNTKNADQFVPRQKVVFCGGGTSDAPQLFEAMGQDRGPMSAGFDRNFVYTCIELAENSYVRLQDLSDNSTGSAPEAVYVNSLVVPAGCTLDLNGLHLYVRLAHVEGTVLQGSIAYLPDSGVLMPGTAATGSLLRPDEYDEWNFYGRARKMVTIDVSLGEAGWPALLPPYLSHALVMLTDSNNQVLASASSVAAGRSVLLQDITLPADGNYRIRVTSPAVPGVELGNYLVTYWDVTIKTSPLLLNRQYSGSIEKPYCRDLWTFSAVAGQQLQFKRINAASSSLQFDLYGPAGWIGFLNLSNNSSLLTLGQGGSYTLVAHGTGTQPAGDYAFVLAETTQQDLAPGSDYLGNLVGSGQAQIFRVAVGREMPMLIQASDSATNHCLELYARLGVPPTRSDYDYRYGTAAAHEQTIVIPAATAGTWYILVYADYAPESSTVTLRVTLADVVLTGVLPDRYSDATDLTLSISGVNLRADSHVSLLSAGGQTYSAAQVIRNDLGLLEATFRAHAVPGGVYTVGVTDPSGLQAWLTNAFLMIAGGRPKLETSIVSPGSLGLHSAATIYVSYTNSGTLSMPAPLLIVSANQGDAHHALLTLDEKLFTAGFWNASEAVGFKHTVQILASGMTTGTLGPGEGARIPVYYAGWDQGWNAFAPVYFSVSTLTSEDSTPVDWSTVFAPRRDTDPLWQESLKPWSDGMGRTWGEYVLNLGRLAARCATGASYLYDGDRLHELLLLSPGSLSSNTPAGSSAKAQPASVALTVGSESMAANAAADSEYAHRGGVYVFKPAAADCWRFLTTAADVDAQLPTEVIIHGLANSVHQDWIKTMAQALYARYASDEAHPTVNILAVDWSTWSQFASDGSYWSWANWISPAKGLSAASRVPEVADRVAWRLFAPLGEAMPGRDGIFGLGLNSAKTHLIGHSHGGHVAGMAAQKTRQYRFGMVDRVTALDPSEEMSHLYQAKRSFQNYFADDNIQGLGWGRGDAGFIDCYKSSDIFGGETAWGDDNFLLVESGFTWGQRWDLETHGYANKWYTHTIQTRAGGRFGLGYNWRPESYAGTASAFSSLQARPGSWKGLIRGQRDADLIEAFDIGTDKDRYPDPWLYPGCWSTEIIGADIHGILRDLAQTVEFDVSEGINAGSGVWQVYGSGSLSFTILDRAQVLSISYSERLRYQDVAHFHYKVWLTKNGEIDEKAMLLTREYFSSHDVLADGTRRFPVQTHVALPSREAIESRWGESLPGYYHLVLDVAPGYARELFPPNNRSAVGILIDGEDVSANAGFDEWLYTDEIGGSVVVYLDGSRSGPKDQIRSYEWSQDGLPIDLGFSSEAAVILDAGWYTFTLTVTDRSGVTHTDTVQIVVQDPGPKPQPPPGPESPSYPVRPLDPNEKLGPAGYGEAGFVSTASLLPYRIDFENDSNATAPAQIVMITDQLDPHLDWNSFELTEIGFGNTLISLPAGLQYYEGATPMIYNDVSFDVWIEAGLDRATGLVYAHFYSIDHLTLLPPDALVGFLPPEDGTRRGQGHVSYGIHPQAGLPTGTVIRNVAEITFDNGEIITTDQVSPHDPSAGIDATKQCPNVIDSGRPISSVLALPSYSRDTNVLVNWTSQDDLGGSGVARVDVFVSDEGGEWTLWTTASTNSSALFGGRPGHTYRFSSTATDHVGNQEIAHATPDTQVRIVDTTLRPRFITASISRTVDDRFQCSITVEPGYQLQLESSTNLVDWTPVSILSNTVAPILFEESRTNHLQRFFRAIQVP